MECLERWSGSERERENQIKIKLNERVKGMMDGSNIFDRVR